MKNFKIHKRGNVLYISYCRNGKRTRKSTGLKACKENVKYIEREIIPKMKYQVDNILDTDLNLDLKYFTDKILMQTKNRNKKNTFILYITAIKRFFEIVGNKKIKSYSVEDMDKFAFYFNTSATAKVYMAPIKLAFKMACRYRVINYNPCEFMVFPKARKKERRAFDYESVKSLLNYAEDELKTFLYIAFYTGARCGEILALTWDDIKDEYIEISKTKLKDGTTNSPKNGKTRRVMLLSPLKEYLAKLPRENGEIVKQSYMNIGTKFKKLQKNLGLIPQTLHTTRHTFASILINADIRPVLVKELLGHSSLEMTNLYTHYIQNMQDKSVIENVFK